MNKRILGVVLMAIGLAGSMQAATRVWVSSVGGTWHSAANWQGGELPGAGDVADLSAATGTIDLTADATVGEILYNPAPGGATKVLTILSDTAAPNSRLITLTTTATRRIQVGAGAELRLDADVKPTGTLRKDGAGTLVFKRRMPTTTLVNFWFEQGRVINEGDMSLYSSRMCLGTVEPDPGAAAEFVMRPGSSYATYDPARGSDLLWGGNRLVADGTGSRAVVTHEGGLLDLTTNATGGVFLNGYAVGGHCVYNLSGGEINLRNKTVYISFKGTGVVNQSSGILRTAAMYFSFGTTATGDGTYNLTGGELWLGGIAQKGGGKAVFNIGGACVYPLNTGFSIYDNTAPQLTGIGGLTQFCSDSSAYTNHISGFKGSGGFIKTGPDTLNIGGSAHSFTGPVIVSNGTLNINQAMTGGNAVTVAGGNVNLGNVAVTYSSLTVTGGVFQVAADAKLNIAGAAPTVRVTGVGALKMLPGSGLPGMTALEVSEDGIIDLSGGGTASVYRLVLDGVEQTPGLYTVATCDAITGGGTLAVNGGLWTGAGGDGLWSTGANWVAGAAPAGPNDTADLSGAVSEGAPAATVVLDLGGVTNNMLILASGIAGAAVTNTCPAGVTNTLYLAAGGVVYVGAGETLVLDNNLVPLGDIYKRGEGTLVLGRKASYPAAKLTYFFVEGGRVVSRGPMLNLSPRVGKPDRNVPGMDPEFINEDLPDARITGYIFLAMMSMADTNPGNGVFIQRGGYVNPSVDWGNRTVVGFAVAGASAGGTGTYRLDGGTLRVTNTLALTLNNGYGVFRQSGGTADIDSFAPRSGEVHLTGGAFKPDRFDNGGAATCTFYLGGIRVEPKGAFTASPALASPLVFTGINGNTAFDVATNITLTLSGAASGSGGFVKEGGGTVTFTDPGAFTGLAEIRAGAVNVGNAWLGTNDVLLTGGTLNVSGGGGFKVADLAITNGTLALASGVIATAQRFFIAGEEVPNGVYTSADYDVITGNGTLIVGSEPGEWTGGGGDDNWSTAANWVAGIVPQSGHIRTDLSAAVSNAAPVRALLLDISAVTNSQLALNSCIAGAVVTNTCPAGVTNTLYLAAEGVIEVGAGETLVLDHDLCIMGSIYKRGEGVLVLRRNTYTLPSLVSSYSAGYITVDGGKVINEGPMANVMISVGKLSRYDDIATPEFVMADTPHAVISGTSFIAALNRLATKPGPGVFTQNGGLVAPGISWVNRLSMAHTAAELAAADYGTGTYNLVSGTLLVSNSMYFGRNGSDRHGHYGIFNQSGGVADIGHLRGADGEMHLTGGTFMINSISVGANITMYLGGGRLEPKGSDWVIFRSPTVFTGENGDMTFAPAAGRTVQFSAAAPSSGGGGFVKEGGGTLQLSNVNAFTGTAALQEGSCVIADAGRLAECTNLLVGAGALLDLRRDGAALNTNMFLRVAAGGTVKLDFEGEVEVGHLLINGYEWPGRGTRYGSSQSQGEVDKVMDEIFTGTGVLKVVGPRGPQGVLIKVR
jgi:fibronectin-binding autotransporter adhesin